MFTQSPLVKEDSENLSNLKESESKRHLSKWVDLTAVTTEKTVVFPGDPEYQTHKVSSLA